MGMNKVIDAFAFYNEVDMLEYRLETLYDYVDKFVIVEATMTHSGLSKPLNFELNKKRYKKYSDKIHHVVNENLQRNGKLKWSHNPGHIPGIHTGGLYYKSNYNVMREYTHIDSIKRPLTYLDIDDNDIILFMAPDEIPNPKMLVEFRENGLDEVGVTLPLNQYFYDCEHFQERKDYNEEGWKTDFWYLSHATTYGQLKSMFNDGYTIYDIRVIDWQHVPNAGWHLSWFESIQDKMNSIVHPNYKTDEELMYSAKHKKPLTLNSHDVTRPDLEYRLRKIKVTDNKFPPPNTEWWEERKKQ